MTDPPEPQDPGQGPLPPFHSWRPSRTGRQNPRLRVWLLVGLGLVLIAAILVSVIFLVLPKPQEAPPPVHRAETTTETNQSLCVTSGEIMPAVLHRAGVPDSTASALIKALGVTGFNFRRMRPGDSLTLTFRSDSLFRVEYRQSYERVYRLDLDQTGIRTSMLLRHIQDVPDTIAGRIQSSLYESLLEIGENPALVADYSGIFDWEIDFFSETQTGDSFVILVERRMADSCFIGYGAIAAARYSGQVGDFSGFRFTDNDGHTDYYNAEGLCLRKTFLKSPLRFSRISSFFGNRYHPIRRIRCPHNGIDYAAPTGTPVSCVADGRVTMARWNGGYGRMVEVTHGGGLATRYGHLSRFGKGVKKGTHVEQGQIIGYVGSTGLSTGPHLHYEVRKSGTPTNPLRLDPPRHEPVKSEFRQEFKALVDSLQPALARLPPQAQPTPLPR